MRSKKYFKGLNVLVTGIGRYPLGSNNSAIRFFSARGAKVTVTNEKPKSEFAVGLKHLKGVKAVYHLGGYRKQDFLNADIVVKNQGNRASEPFLRIAERRGVFVSTDVGIFMELCPSVTTVGVTGTRGKSTTTALLGEMVKAAKWKSWVGGNMKVSPLNFLDEVVREGEKGNDAAVVLELSSWLIEGWGKQGIAPDIAVVTNVFSDHLNTYPSFSAYVRAKTEIFRAQNENGVVVLNRDNAETRKMAKLAKGRVLWFSRRPFAGHGACVSGGRIVYCGDKKEAVAKLTDIKHLAGGHNLENVLAAVTAAKVLGITNAAIVKVLRSFRGLPYRQETLGVKSGVKFVNDTTATSPDGASAALKALSGKGKKNIVLIAGGTDKGLEFSVFAKDIKKYAKALVLFQGTATDKLIVALKRAGFRPELAPIVSDMKTAVKVAADLAARGDIVLLSPGAASFGLFKNEFDRGEQFNKEVKRI